MQTTNVTHPGMWVSGTLTIEAEQHALRMWTKQNNVFQSALILIDQKEDSITVFLRFNDHVWKLVVRLQPELYVMFWMGGFYGGATKANETTD